MYQLVTTVVITDRITNTSIIVIAASIRTNSTVQEFVALLYNLII